MSAELTPRTGRDPQTNLPRLKRVFDVAASGFGLVAAAPAIITCSAALMAANRSWSPFFVQYRVGLHGRPFKIYKIKTMRDPADRHGRPLTEDERLTAAGRFIRKTRLDELPQLFNVLKGDMSLVGPRPLQPLRPIAADPVRCAVRPGLTGLAQLHGTTGLPLEDILAHDRRYVQDMKSRSPLCALSYDLGIIARTPAALVRHRNAPDYRPQ